VVSSETPISQARIWEAICNFGAKSLEQPKAIPGVRLFMNERRSLLALLLSFASATFVSSVERASSNPYQGIVSRNSFGLTPAKSEVPPPAPLPKVHLLGITTFGDKRAILKVLWPAKRGEPARDKTFMLKNHQRAGEIEVIEIDELATTARVRISGTVSTISFESERGISPGGSLPTPPQPPS